MSSRVLGWCLPVRRTSCRIFLSAKILTVTDNCLKQRWTKASGQQSSSCLCAKRPGCRKSLILRPSSSHCPPQQQNAGPTIVLVDGYSEPLPPDPVGHQGSALARYAWGTSHSDASRSGHGCGKRLAVKVTSAILSLRQRDFGLRPNSCASCSDRRLPSSVRLEREVCD